MYSRCVHDHDASTDFTERDDSNEIKAVDNDCPMSVHRHANTKTISISAAEGRAFILQIGCSYRADYPEEACRVWTVTASWFCGCVGVPDGKGVQESLRSAYTDPVSLPALPMLFLGFLEPLSPSSRTNKCSTHSG